MARTTEVFGIDEAGRGVAVGFLGLAIGNRVLVFVLYKKEAARVETMLQKRGWKVVSIHGDKAQHARTKALSLFKEGSCPLMIATDVAARGLDIPDVEVVINYSFPLTTEDYVLQ
ncbi:DEAD-box ATP-dependent RNA helicase 5 [Camellia lanceoleosa]|uniref:DEAD-box ATP-dependent RNA helicase 5 n=1 Tax=Camellia lanceoleosa TaxID=1840588 RepID=A0ACC0G1U7_9ERIC|nr:DEAD-box ATP-dependent RNA helicase 5 [Camellia lanceoleosa]